jgi:hypothetical protein
MADREPGEGETAPTAVLEALADHDEFEVDLDDRDAEATSDRLSVDTPAGWLAFDALPPEDYGAEHERHDPDDDVYVNMWFVHGSTVVHTQRGVGDGATHAVEVHEQRPPERALELEAHGIPERRAEVAALRERGLTYSEIVEATGSGGPNHRGDVSRHLQRYNEQLQHARWLAEHAHPVSLGGRGSSADEGGDPEGEAEWAGDGEDE